MIGRLGTLVLLVATQAQAQQFRPLREDGNGIAALTKLVAVHVRGERLGDALRLTARQAGADFSAADLPALLDRRVTLDVASVRVSVALLRLVEGTDVELLVSPAGPTIVARTLRPVGSRRPPEVIQGIILDSAVERPISDARIELRSRGGALLGRTSSSAAGQFTLRGVTDPDATLRVRDRRQSRVLRHHGAEPGRAADPHA